MEIKLISPQEKPSFEPVALELRQDPQSPRGYYQLTGRLRLASSEEPIQDPILGITLIHFPPPGAEGPEHQSPLSVAEEGPPDDEPGAYPFKWQRDWEFTTASQELVFRPTPERTYCHITVRSA